MVRDLSKENDCVYTIKRNRLAVWGSVNKSIVKRNPVFIDDFEEISEEEFRKMYEEWLDMINE